MVEVRKINRQFVIRFVQIYQNVYFICICACCFSADENTYVSVCKGSTEKQTLDCGIGLIDIVFNPQWSSLMVASTTSEDPCDSDVLEATFGGTNRCRKNVVSVERPTLFRDLFRTFVKQLSFCCSDLKLCGWVVFLCTRGVLGGRGHGQSFLGNHTLL